MPKLHRSRQPRDWSKEQSKPSIRPGTFLAIPDRKIKEVRVEDEIFLVRRHMKRLEKEIKNLESIPKVYFSKSIDSMLEHADRERKILNKKKLLGMSRVKLKELDRKVASKDRRFDKLRQRGKQGIDIILKPETEQERKIRSRLTNEQILAISSVFPEKKKQKVVSVGGKKKLVGVSKKRFALK